nr:alpha/beta hydrolase [Streptomyces sp. SID5468]
MLHALCLDSRMWRAQAAALRDRGHLVLTPGQRGFGGTPLGTDPPSLDLVADDVARLLDAHGVERAVLAGCSMGGYVAMAFLRRHRDRVRALALLSTRGTADPEETAAGRRRFAELVVDDTARGPLVAATTPSLLGPTTRAARPEVLAEVMAAARAASPAAVAWAQRAIAARPDAMAELRAFPRPAVVVAGEEDGLVGAEESGALAAALPGARLVTLPATGHLPPLEAPERTTAALAALLDETVAADRKGAAAC